MLLILGLGLLPLGVLAVLATLDSARENRAKGEVEARTVLAISAQRLTSAVARSAITIRAASDAISESQVGSGTCQRTLSRLAELQPSLGRYALFEGANRFRCATPGYEPPPIPEAAGSPSLIRIEEGGALLRFFLFDENGDLEGVGEFTREALAELIDSPQMPRDVDLALTDGDRVMTLRDGYSGAALAREVALEQPLASGRLGLRIRTAAVPITPAELLMILMPVLMWMFAAAGGWFVVDRLLLRPLARMQAAVAAYRPGDRAIDLPVMRSPAREIGALGEAFNQVTRTVASHEAELEAAVERQTRLVREVHHRVKNNLQVVASLLNLHSRGSANEDVAAAYASIQRRVDALAVVHRNHYAELEENRGVALRSLISELGANLRATAPASAAGMQIRIGIEPFYATQDVAVSVAFLITETVEFAMLCGATSMAITLEEVSRTSARLTIESRGLAGGSRCDSKLVDRFERIITGLSRQLRSTLDRDPEVGRYSLLIGVVDKAEG